MTSSNSKEIDDHQLGVSDRIAAMRSQEKKTPRCRNYLNSTVDATCRTAMVDWCFLIADSFHLSRETVGIATSLLDRYLSSGRGRSTEALRSKETFQLAAITSFYVSAKTHEPVQLGIGMLIRLCRGRYTKRDVFAMERDVLFSLDWRVCASSSTTPMEYARHFLELVPEWTDVADAILDGAAEHADGAARDVRFSTCRASALGAACFAAALDDARVPLSSFEKGVLWRGVNRKAGFELETNETREVERRLLARLARSCEPKRRPRASLPRAGPNAAGEQLLSPVSVRSEL